METRIKHLIEGCRRQERKAQQALYQIYAPTVYRTCLRITGNPEEAEEAMQDCFLKILAHIGDFAPDSCFEAWIRKIAVRTAIDHIRRQTEDWEELPENYPDTPSGTEDDSYEESLHYTVELIRQAIRELAAGYRVILSLYLFEGYDMEEIASILHLQPASVRSQYMRGKRKLQEIIKRNQTTWIH